jgi:hypothetical protein
MDYMFLIYVDEPELMRATPEEHALRYERSWVILDEARSKGIFKGASPLKPVSTAVSVKSNGARVEMTDGPFAETKEVLGGFWILDCRDLDEAKIWATRLSKTGCAATVEIRPIQALPERSSAPEPVGSASFVNA